MKIIIDIGHPAHVHIFKYFVLHMQRKGHKILFTVREKENEVYLLQYYKFQYISFGKKETLKFRRILQHLINEIKLLYISFKFKPAIFISHGSIYAAIASFLINRPHISLEDSGNMEQVRLYRPFTKIILSPDILPERLGCKQIRYSAYHELFYLHPKYFSPDDNIFKFLSLNFGEPYCIIRFVAWNATHDIGNKGFTNKQKSELISFLSKRMKVFITSESELPEQFKEYKINIPPEKMHDALAFATIYIGEGATMASEAGVLGTPAIYINTIKRSYCEDQEKYNLVFNYRSGDDVIRKALNIIDNARIKEISQNNKRILLSRKINPTPFFIWFVENFPKSIKIIREDPDYQYNFR